ncbi:MAG: hypothetical protein V7724_18490 [Sediminicola sp.]
MKIINNYLLVCFYIFFSACSSDDGSPELPREEVPNPPKEEIIIPDPSPAFLVFPKDNTECNEGEIESDTTSIVTFEWNFAENTDSYEIRLINLSNYEVQIEQSTTNTLSLSILRGTPYEWYVISKANGTPKTVTSEAWQFYNAGPANESYTPFPATLIYPENGAVKKYSQDRLALKWEGLDLDNDIVEYEVYFGIEEAPVDLLIATSNTEHHFWSTNLTFGTTYYWRIKTIDLHGNSSMSQIFSCVVNN